MPPRGRPQVGQTKTRYYPLNGGLDVTTPALSVDPGFALAMVNYEPYFNGGYRRIDGYERFDGRSKPSDATFYACTLNTVAGLVVGNVIVDDATHATAVIVGIDVASSKIGFTKKNGNFNNGDTLNSAAYTIISAPILRDAPTADLEDTWLLQAQDDYRQDIQKVPGVGDVLGIWQRNANVYAWRDRNDSASGATMYLASTNGWTTSGVTMAQYIYFKSGVNEFAEGDSINGATSGATATVHRVIDHGGATGTGDARGYLVLISVVGTFQSGENLRKVSTVYAVANGVNTQFNFPPGGHYQFVNHNFFGGSGTFRTYGVNGLGPAFEIDENNIVSPILFPSNPITDQPDTNTPFLIEEHRNVLFLAIPGGRLIASVSGEPMTFNGFLGAADFGIGDEITGLISVVGNVLAVTSERETHGLYGKDITDWDLELIGEKAGAKIYTAQKIDTVYSLNDLGISSLARTQSYGNFAGTTVSQLIQPIVQALRQKWTTSSIVRHSNQYRVYFNDGSFLIMYVPGIGQQNRAFATAPDAQFGYAQYPIVVDKIYDTEDENGAEVTYFASDDGYVYQDQIGTSFDGAEIASYVRLAFNHVGSPAYRKKFRRADLEINSNKPLTLKFQHDLTYGSTESSSGISDLTAQDIPVINIFAGGGFFDVDSWDTFFWDGQPISTARANLDGTGENIGFLIFNQSATAQPFILQGITIHYDLRRLQR